MIDLSYDIGMWAEVSFILSQFTRLTDRQTDGRTDRQTDKMAKTDSSSKYRGCIVAAW